MPAQYALSPQAARDLFEIWLYIKTQSSEQLADQVEQVIKNKFLLLASHPQIGHTRPNLTAEPVKFFTVYSYLIVYLPETRPLAIVAILHGYRDLESILPERI